jgi:hypothetical protein
MLHVRTPYSALHNKCQGNCALQQQLWNPIQQNRRRTFLWLISSPTRKTIAIMGAYGRLRLEGVLAAR